jgi:LacI family transcriptional regulator
LVIEDDTIEFSIGDFDIIIKLIRATRNCTEENLRTGETVSNLTIYDIATEAGVSITTVSRVINDSRKVASSTRRKVELVLNKYNYSPNAIARALVHKSMKTVGILMPDIKNRHFSITASVLENLFFEQGYNTLLCNTGDDLEKKKKYIMNFAGNKIDGLILLGSVFNDVEIEKMLREHLSEIPVIVSNASLPLPNAYSVLIDHNIGMNIAVEHLAEKGHKYIAFVHAVETYNTQRKKKGFIEALKRLSLPIYDNQNVFETLPGFEGGEIFAENYLKNKGNFAFTAFIFFEDLTAIGAQNVFRGAGIEIPQDIAIIGHDNSVFSHCAMPKLTTVDTKVEAIAEVMANTLIDLFQGKQVGQSIILRPGLILRDSS